MTMNIILVYDFGHINGGAAQVAISSALALKKVGNNVVYFCAVSPIDSSLISAGVKVVCTHQLDIKTDPNIIRKSTQAIWNYKARKALRTLLEGYSPSNTVVHFHGWFKALSPSILTVPDKLGFCSFITLHDFFVYCPNGGLYNYQQNKICDIFPMSKKCLLCNCDRDSYINKLWRYLRHYVQNIFLKRQKNLTFISISDLSEREYKRCYRFQKYSIVRISNPVTFPLKENRDYADSYLFMGRLSNEKGIDIFCEAIRRTGVHGIVLGDGALRGVLERKYPDVEFAGWVSNDGKASFLRRTKVFVFPSVCYETFGLSVAEVLSVGIPCIVGDMTAAAELIDEGQNGLLFKTGDLNSLIKAIKTIENDYHLFDHVAFDKSTYSMDNHVKTLLQTYTRELNDC